MGAVLGLSSIIMNGSWMSVLTRFANNTKLGKGQIGWGSNMAFKMVLKVEVEVLK